MLRCLYQSIAASASSQRQGELEPILLSPLQAGMEEEARVLPRHQLKGSAVDLLKAAMDLLAPRFLRAVVNGMTETVNRRIDSTAPRPQAMLTPAGPAPP